MKTGVGLTTRAQRVQVATSQRFDLIVVGGGIHGVCTASLAARAGLSVLLLEAKDYAHATSSRSSKMAHGGLRYLEMFDFQQVFEGIKSREELFEKCPNLVVPERFLIPIPRGQYWLRFKLRIGLILYDLMVRNPQRRHRWIPRQRLPFASFNSQRSDLDGCYQYTDGLMSDARLVFELLTDGQQRGLCALNYARVDAVEQQADSGLFVSWSDTLTGDLHHSRARLVINCAGPWAPDIREKNSTSGEVTVKYSRGSHLIFSVPWRDPSLFLPLEEKGRYYFVWPHPAGTMVGTTEREVTQLESDPLPSADEVDEILARLEKDLPGMGLTRDTLCYAFAGIRTLPVRSSKKGVSQLSRKHIWRYDRGVLTLLGGKYTTFAWTASEGLAQALQYLGKATLSIPAALDGLPSAIGDDERQDLCIKLKDQLGLEGVGVERAVQRLGRQVLDYIDRPDAWREIEPGVLALEVLHAIEVEQSETIEDVLRRRLELEAMSSHGLGALGAVKELLSMRYPQDTIDVQEARWRAQLERLEGILQSS
jgi:glycerol-3-phosphate dehydrogenase